MQGVDLRGKVALVTGGSGAIGGAICTALARAGAAVAVHYGANWDGALQVADRIRSEGGRAVVVGGDVASEEDVERFFREVREELGRVDILVNNAGTLRDGLVVRMRLEDWRRVLDTNLTGTFLCTREALRDMLRARWGRIVNVTSVVGLVGNAGQANYVAAKAGIVGFTKAVAREVASRNITVNAIAPGYVHSRMTEGLDEEQRRFLTSQIPLGRTGVPEEIAPAVVFLCSDQAAYITGHVLNVDGGMVMR